MRKASAQARPTRINGVALVNVSVMPPRLPKATLAMWAYVAMGSPPTNAIRMPPKISATITAASEVVSDSPGEVPFRRGSICSVIGSRRTTSGVAVVLDMRCGSLWADLIERHAGHHQPDRLSVPVAHLAHDLPFVNHVNPIAQRQQLFQFFGDQQHTGAG